jgi:hypothetical protein
MIFAQKGHFAKIISIELQPALFNCASTRFSAYKHIEIVQGDSATVLPNILRTLPRPALFWLDAHYSGGIMGRGNLETPISVELNAIFSDKGKRPAILIDDARCFDGTADYPTLDMLRRVVSVHADLEMTVATDIIRILPCRLDQESAFEERSI